jgi:hypothetical protein
MNQSSPPHAVRCLKAEGGRQVWLIDRPGEGPRIIKRWPLTLLMAVKIALGASQPQRQVRGAARLARSGIRTPRPCGSWRVVRMDRRRLITIELEYAEGQTAWAILNDPAVPEAVKARCAHAVGSLVAEFRWAGLFNRDLKLMNLIIDHAADEVLVSVIDPMGVRRMRDTVDHTERMLERLAILPLYHHVPVPRGVVIAVLHSALSGLEKVRRRAVLQRLREHLTRRSDQWRRAWRADRR